MSWARSPSARPGADLVVRLATALCASVAWLRLRTGPECTASYVQGPHLDAAGCGHNPYPWLEPGALAWTAGFALCLAILVGSAIGNPGRQRAAGLLALVASAALAAQAATDGIRHLVTVNNGTCLPHGLSVGRAPCEIAGDLRAVWAYGLTALVGLAGVLACAVLLVRDRRPAAVGRPGKWSL